MQLNKTHLEQLEALIDATSLVSIFDGLVEICNGKAEHLRSNWQDPTAARAWEADAKRIDKLIPKISNG